MFAAADTLVHVWPDGIDWVVTAAYLALVVGVAVAGYVCMALDIRDYLRSLRRALVVIGQYRMELPDWIRTDTPRCIQALGLTLPCTAEEVLVVKSSPLAPREENNSRSEMTTLKLLVATKAAIRIRGTR